VAVLHFLRTGIVKTRRPDKSIPSVESDRSLYFFLRERNILSMEPAGLAVGVFAIAGLFNNAVDCFEYVQLGRTFKTNFTTCILKLDDAKLRLSRWGQAVGLSGDLHNTEELNRIFGVEETKSNAEERLRHILRLFTDAEDISQKFRSGVEPNNALQLCSAHDELDPEMKSVRDKLRTLSVKRQNVTPIMQKAKWALYEEKHFRKLIEDIISTIDNLIDLFPSAIFMQRELCNREAAELVRQTTRQILGDILAEQDTLLESAIARLARQQVSNLCTQTEYYAQEVIPAPNGQQLEQLRRYTHRSPGSFAGDPWRADVQHLM
jgi:hypothetical protein